MKNWEARINPYEDHPNNKSLFDGLKKSIEPDSLESQILGLREHIAEQNRVNKEISDELEGTKEVLRITKLGLEKEIEILETQNILLDADNKDLKSSSKWNLEQCVSLEKELEQAKNINERLLSQISDYVQTRGKAIHENEAMYNWLFQYLEELKSTNVFHKNEGIINSIDKILPKK